MRQHERVTRRTVKMLLGGKLIRSESGRVVFDGDTWTPNASRKDARDAVRASYDASESWGQTRALLRGQILYRAAETMAQRDELQGSWAAAQELTYWAGWCDKITTVAGSVNAVSGMLSVTTVVPAGTVCAFIEGETQEEVLMRSCEIIGAALVAGCSLTLLIECRWGQLAQSLGEIMSVSDIPSGVLNILTTDDPETSRCLAGAGEMAVCDTRWTKKPFEWYSEGASHLQRRVQKGAKELDLILAYSDAKTVWHASHQ
jgi:hypothetical protein